MSDGGKDVRMWLAEAVTASILRYTPCIRNPPVEGVDWQPRVLVAPTQSTCYLFPLSQAPCKPEQQ